MRGVNNNFSIGLARGAKKELLIVGIPLVFSLAAAALWPGVLTVILAVALVAVFGLLLYFLRDPRRSSPETMGVFLAPADGEVMAVERVFEPRFFRNNAWRISVFMSVFDVHVNRVPVEGRVALVEHHPGQYLQAFKPESANVNEHNLVGLESRYGKVMVKQIAGILARRVVCWIDVDQQVAQGQRLGVIKFGSRVDLFLPEDAEPLVVVGDRTSAGVTVVARWLAGEHG